MLIIHMFILLCDRGAITSSLRSFEPLVCHSEMGKSLSVVPNGTTNKLADLFFRLSPLMLSVMQGSYNYQLLSLWFNPTLNRTPSLPFQKQTLYPLGHLSGNNLFGSPFCHLQSKSSQASVQLTRLRTLYFYLSSF